MTDRKISSFTGQVTIPSDALLTLVSGSQNYKISYTDFLNAIGFSGSISQAGDDGTPILDQPLANVSVIRNLFATTGLKSSITDTDGIKIETDLTKPEDGTQILVNEDSAPLIRSLVAGDGMTITVTDDVITLTSGDVTPSFASSSFEENSNETVITDITEPEPVDATWVEGESEDFTFASGVWTYTGTKTKRFMVSCASTLSRAGLSALDLISTYIAKNDSIITAGVPSLEMNGTAQAPFVNQTIVSLETGDTISLYVGNLSQLNAVTVICANLIIRTL